MTLNTPEAVEAFVRDAHAGQTDKIGVPYIEHVLAVARGLEPFGPDLVMAGLLHDVLEDTRYTVEDLVELGVPWRVRLAVTHVTNIPGTPYLDQIRRITAYPDALLVKIADNAHNSRPERAMQLPVRTRLQLKLRYGAARAILWEAARPEDVRAIVSRVTPELLEELEN